MAPKGEGKAAKGGVKKAAAGKEKKVKDPNAPKKPKSAYFFFMDEARPKARAANPEAKIGDLGKIMGAQWNEIKETAEAEKFHKQAAADKIRYEKAKKEYEEKKAEEKPEEPEEEAVEEDSD